MSRTSKRLPLVWELSRTSSSPPDASEASTRADAVGAAIRHTGHVTLLTVHDPDAGLRHFVVASDVRDAQRVAGNLEGVLGAKQHRLDDDGVAALLELLDVSSLTTLLATPSVHSARETQAGGNPVMVAEYLGRTLSAGEWVACSLRAPSKGEMSAVRRWFEHRMSGVTTHYSRKANALAASFVAGSQTHQSGEALLSGLTAAIPGFDIESRAVKPAGKARLMAAWLAALIVGAPVFLGLPGDLRKHWPGVPKVGLQLYVMVAVVAIVALLAVVTGRVRSSQAKLLDAVCTGHLPMPPKRKMPPSPPRNEQRQRTADGREQVRRASDGSYPLHRQTFYVSPGMVVGMVSPHTGTAVAATTQQRACPPVLRTVPGPLIGYSDDQPVRISQADRFAGVGIFGKAGTGKSALMFNFVTYDALDRCRPSNLPGHLGSRLTQVVFESKGADGVDVYRKALSAIGAPVLVCEVGDPSTPCLDLFDVPGTVAERAAFFVDAMQYAWGSTAIGDRSKNTLRTVFTAALHVTPDDLERAGLDRQASVVDAASVLLCARGEDLGKRLYGSLLNRAADHEDDHELRDCVQRLDPLYGQGSTPGRRATLCEAPMSKVETLLECRVFWDRRRPKVTWEQILTQHWAFIINTGPTSSGVIVNESVTNALSAMTMYSLRHAIMRHCTGWREQSRGVAIYSDELSLLAGAGGGEVIEWLRNQGRSFGVWCAFASQYLDQLTPGVRKAVASLSTFFWFGQDSTEAAGQAAADAGADGTDWSVGDITRLPPHHAVLRASVAQQRQPAFVAKIAYWGDRWGEFEGDQRAV